MTYLYIKDDILLNNAERFDNLVSVFASINILSTTAIVNSWRGFSVISVYDVPHSTCFTGLSYAQY